MDGEVTTTLPINTHPQPVRERSNRECNDEDGEDGADEHDQRLGGDEIEEKPQDPGEERRSVRPETRKPILDDREKQGDGEEVGQADQEVGDGEGKGAA